MDGLKNNNEFTASKELNEILVAAKKEVESWESWQHTDNDPCGENNDRV